MSSPAFYDDMVIVVIRCRIMIALSCDDDDEIRYRINAELSCIYHKGQADLRFESKK